MAPTIPQYIGLWQNHRTQEFDAGKNTLLSSRPEWPVTSCYIHSFSWSFWCIVLWHSTKCTDSCNYDHNLIHKTIYHRILDLGLSCNWLCLAVFSESCVYKQCTVATCNQELSTYCGLDGVSNKNYSSVLLSLDIWQFSAFACDQSTAVNLLTSLCEYVHFCGV